MPRLERLHADHEQAVLAFERANRDYFSASISDRGDAYFDDFAARHRDLLADQLTGTVASYVLVDDEDEVIGRFNLRDIADGCATVGYRLAARVAGRGVATAALRDLCAIAAGLGLQTLVAATADRNIASQRVLTKAGFVPDGPADPAELGGKLGGRYRLTLDVTSGRA